VATNAFRVKSILTGETSLMSGDNLIQIRGLDHDEIVALCQEMERVASFNAARETRRITRSSAAAAEEDGTEASAASISPSTESAASATAAHEAQRGMIFSSAASTASFRNSDTFIGASTLSPKSSDEALNISFLFLS
jgi:hypothetical protein